MMHVVTMVTLAHSETAAIQLGCDGQMIEPTAKNVVTANDANENCLRQG
jgi:hypothetical protein